MKTHGPALLLGSTLAIGLVVLALRTPSDKSPSSPPARSSVPKPGDSSAAMDRISENRSMVAYPLTKVTISPEVHAPPGVTPPKSSQMNRAAPQTNPIASLPGKSKALVDPTARVALSLVGIDAGAEAYWVEAIGNPELSDKER